MKNKKPRILTGGTATSDAQTSLKLPKPLTIIGGAQTAKATRTGGTGTVNNKKMKKAAPAKATAKKTSYIGNVAKEVKQTVKRVSNAVDKMDKKAYEAKYGRKMPGKIGSSKIKEQIGQTAGALLQGRRYNDKTGKQIMAKKAVAKKTVAKKITKKK